MCRVYSTPTSSQSFCGYSLLVAKFTFGPRGFDSPRGNVSTLKITLSLLYRVSTIVLTRYMLQVFKASVTDNFLAVARKFLRPRLATPPAGWVPPLRLSIPHGDREYAYRPVPGQYPDWILCSQTLHKMLNRASNPPRKHPALPTVLVTSFLWAVEGSNLTGPVPMFGYSLRSVGLENISNRLRFPVAPRNSKTPLW